MGRILLVYVSYMLIVPIQWLGPVRLSSLSMSFLDVKMRTINAGYMGSNRTSPSISCHDVLLGPFCMSSTGERGKFARFQINVVACRVFSHTATIMQEAST